MIARSVTLAVQQQYVISSSALMKHRPVCLSVCLSPSLVHHSSDSSCFAGELGLR